MSKRSVMFDRETSSLNERYYGSVAAALSTPSCYHCSLKKMQACKWKSETFVYMLYVLGKLNEATTASNASAC
jgi:hypothetical protein